MDLSRGSPTDMHVDGLTYHSRTSDLGPCTRVPAAFAATSAVAQALENKAWWQVVTRTSRRPHTSRHSRQGPDVAASGFRHQSALPALGVVDAAALERLLVRLPGACDTAHADFNAHGFKTSHLAWYIFPCNRKGHSEPAPGTWLTATTGVAVRP